MFCRYCGNELNDDAVFCSQCGKVIDKKARGKKKIKIKKPNKWHFIFGVPMLVFIVILLKVNSIRGHWYQINGFGEELYFNANGSFANSDTGSILGTYIAKNGLLTLSSSHENMVLAYKIKWGKLYLYKGNKEYIYARIVKKGEPQSVLLTQIKCVEDSESFIIYSTDISGKTFITDETDEPQYRYKIVVELNNEQMQLFENFTKDHLYHDIEVVTENYGSQVIHIDSIITDGRVAIAYFDNESDARVYYKTIGNCSEPPKDSIGGYFSPPRGVIELK